MQIMAGTPQMKLFTALLMDSIIANIMYSPFILFSGGMEGEKHIRREDYENQVFGCLLSTLHPTCKVSVTHEL